MIMPPLVVAIFLTTQSAGLTQGLYLEPKSDPAVFQTQLEMPAQNYLRGSVEKQNLKTETSLSASAEDEELLIEWDRWRNRFMRAVWSKFNAKLVNGIFIPVGPTGFGFGPGRPNGFKNGTKATFQCEVTSDRRVRNARIVKSSGNREFDDMVLASILAQDGKRVCKFPADSRRTTVKQAGIMSIRPDIAWYDKGVYNDREHVKAPAR